MTYEITIVEQGFLLPTTPAVSPTGGNAFAVVVPELTLGVAYTRVRAEQAPFVVVFSFDANEERAVAAAASGIARRLSDAQVVHAHRVSMRDGVLRARVVTESGARVAVEALSAAAGASMMTAALQFCVSLFDLVFMPTERDSELRRRLELDLRGAEHLELDVQRWLEMDRDER
jgi:hypothetical protein